MQKLMMNLLNVASPIWKTCLLKFFEYNYLVFAQIAINEAPSDVNTTLDGLTYPR